ncbi:MAG: fasciclin domain-containing protein [Methanosarcinaceae archaeon]|nr:fasciclin domain-containing protein [Methanosarcinaceae archaeon]
MVTINGTEVFINNARVTVVDLQAENGVVHVIDAVLIPPEEPTNEIPIPEFPTIILPIAAIIGLALIFRRI